MRIFFLWTYFFLCFNALLLAQEVKYGLGFKSYEVEKEKRTSLDLTPEKPFSFSQGFSISFDALFVAIGNQQGIETRFVNPIFGYILHIEGNDYHKIDIILKPESEELNNVATLPNIIITRSETEPLVNYNFRRYGNTYNEWIHIAITVEANKNQLTVAIGNEKYSFKIDDLEEFKNVRFVFGKNNYQKFLISDVPPMIIKDVTISDLNKKTLYRWSLSKHTSGGVYDEIKRHFAVCLEPLWILDEHVNWEMRSTINTKMNPQICWNETENTLAIADDNEFVTYNTTNKKLRKDILNYGKPHSNSINQLVYNQLIGKYCSYSCDQKASFYDPVTKSWDNPATDTYINYWNHNQYIYPGDSCLYTFFGYGYHKYSNEIIRYNFKTGSFEKVTFGGDRIQPRHLSGLGKIDDHQLIVFGGYGSETGKQELNSQNYYDAYIINLETKTIKKLWNLNITDQNFVVSNSLVVDTIQRCFYALCYPQQEFKTCLHLYRFYMDKPLYEILADSIPFNFQDIYSYVDLFQNNQDNDLIAVAASPLPTDSTSAVSVYSLEYPPLAKGDLYQQKTQENKTWIVLGGIAALLALSGGYVVYRKKSKQKADFKIEQDSDFKPDYAHSPVVGIKPLNTHTEKQSIFLFGGFQVMDKDGRNITEKFTPLLKELFVIILLYTLKDGKGISSVKLRETLWFDKSDESAKNNRGVSLSKLRQIFEQIGAIQIKNENSCWIIEFGEDIYCDYYEALILMNQLKNRNNRTNTDIRRLLSIVSSGELLPDLQIEWIDSFKADFANDLIDLFLDIVRQNGLDISDHDRVNLVDSVLIHDFLNEEAFKLKCVILVRMGKNGLAQKTYNSFSKEYKSLFGTDYKYTFEQVIFQ